MSARHEPALVIDDGGLAALVACMICPDPQAVLVWVPPLAGTQAPRRLRAVRRHADLLDLRDVIEAPPLPDVARQPRSGPAFLAEPRLLLAAAAEALSARCARLVWPVHCGESLDDMALAADRARLINHLVDLEAGEGAPLTVETPLLDLTDAQLAELALDLDAPLDACRWCEADADEACGRCAACRKWGSLFQRRGASVG